MAIGKEIDNFVKTFLATYKMGKDFDYKERRLKLEEDKLKGMSPEDMQKFLAAFGVNDGTGGGSSGGSGGGTPRTTEEQRAAAQERMSYLVNDKGLDPKVAAGIVGNTWHEGAGFQTTVKGDNGNSFGEFQFNNRGEMPAFTSWARQNDRNINDWKTQYDFVVDRLNGPYKGVLERMQKAGDHRAAADAFMRGYERPSVPHLERRQSFADQAFGGFSERGYKPGAVQRSALPPATQPAEAPAETPASPPAALPSFTTQPLPRLSSVDEEPSEQSTQMAEAEMEQPTQTAALPMDEEDTAFAAKGGMIEPQHDQAIAAALKDIQNSLGQDNAALPDADPQQGQRMEAFQRGAGALSPEAYDALRQAVDPDGMNPDATRDAMDKIYRFYASKGDKAAAAKASSGVLQAARNRSMEFGKMAGDALQQKNYPLAARALASAYNEVPDGKRVTAEVNEQGVGRALVMDGATDKVVEEMPLDPRTLGVAAMQFMGGNQFYAHLARSMPRSSQKAPANG